MSDHVRISPRAPASPVRPPAATTGLLQRKCYCGGSSPSGGECEECKKRGETLQRKAGSGWEQRNAIAPPIVHDVLRSPGQSLDASARAFFEPRVRRTTGSLSGGDLPKAAQSELTITRPGDHYEQAADRFADRVLASKNTPDDGSQTPRFDLSRIRIHTDQPAAEAAASVNARAFTVGTHLVFGEGSYNHKSSDGRWLIAHELAHTMQQTGKVARQSKDDPAHRPLPPHDPSPGFSPVGSCYGSAICKDLLTPSKLLAQAAANPTNQGKRDHRKQICQGTPPPADCTADGHGAPATQAEKLLHGSDASLPLPGVKVIVDKDLEQEFGGLTINCSQFVPPISGATTCITIPDRMEQEAAQFNNTQDSKIGGKERGLWRERTLEILVHESGHARFREAFHAGRVLASQPSCANQDTLSAMNELVAMLGEFPLRMERIHTSVGLSDEDRKQELEEWRNHRIRGLRQSITVSLRTVRCVCACDDANKMIKETIEFATASWTQQQKNELHREMRDPQWADLDLRWPFVAPGAPSVQAVPARSQPATGAGAATPSP
jgi:Domain of unknown function (DUF4157)